MKWPCDCEGGLLLSCPVCGGHICPSCGEADCDAAKHDKLDRCLRQMNEHSEWHALAIKVPPPEIQLNDAGPEIESIAGMKRFAKTPFGPEFVGRAL